MGIKEIKDTEFESEVIKSDKPTLVDFWAPWCGPCKAQAPILDAVAQELGESAKIVKVNVDENQQTPMQYGVMSIPTLIIFKNGQITEQMVGLQQKEDLKKKLVV